MKDNLIINKKTTSGFDSFIRNDAPLNEENMPNVIIDNSQDKNEVIIDESVTPCQPTPQLHNDIDTPPLQNSFTPAKEPESDMSTVKIESLITALKSYVSCEISMIHDKLTSFCEHINKKLSNSNHREDKHLESLQDNISFLQKELLMKNEIIKSLTETQTVVLGTISTLQRKLTANKNSSDAPETPSNTANTTLATHYQYHQQQQQPQNQTNSNSKNSNSSNSSNNNNKNNCKSKTTRKTNNLATNCITTIGKQKTIN